MNDRKICCKCKFYRNSQLYCEIWETKKVCNETCSDFELSKPIDWEQRRYEIAKEVLPFAIGDFGESDSHRTEDGVHYAVNIADTLIEILKKG